MWQWVRLMLSTYLLPLIMYAPLPVLSLILRAFLCISTCNVLNYFLLLSKTYFSPGNYESGNYYELIPNCAFAFSPSIYSCKLDRILCVCVLVLRAIFCFYAHVFPTLHSWRHLTIKLIKNPSYIVMWHITFSYKMDNGHAAGTAR